MKPNATSSPFDPAAALAAAPESAVPDADNPETKATDWEHAKVTHGGGVAATVAELRRYRGPQNAPTKVLTSLRLSPEVVAFFKATGKGWQTRVDEALKEYMREHSENR
jgi:uncharacterized protein (DUF4415 family)